MSLERLIKKFQGYAQQQGIKLYEFESKKIQPKESVRLKCLIPLCEYYGVCKICPPNIPEVWQFKEALKDYQIAFLVVLQEEIKTLEKYQFDFSAELKLAEVVLQLEKIAFEEGCYQALGLIVGGCKYCKKCAPHDEPCRHPFKARPSPEGFGIDISKIARNLGVAIEWPPKRIVTFLGLILI